MNSTHIIYSARHAFVAALLVFTLGVCTFFAFEPSVGRAITDSFTVTQTISSEISFLVNAADVTMSGTPSGMTGGYATGTTQTVILTNNSTGYNMTLHFATSTSGRSMQASSTAYINDYTPASAGVPDYSWIDNASGGSAEFGYTIIGSSTAEVAQSFLQNGSVCNSAGGANSDNNRCWLNPTTSPKTIINATTPTPTSGSTTTIKFKVAVPNAPSPALPSGNYVATGWLTAVVNP